MNTPRIPKRLTAAVGAAAAAVLVLLVPQNEGTKFTTYRDLGGKLTYCTGATADAQWGKTYSPAECSAQLDHDLALHAEGISHCIRMDALTNGQKVAYVDTAYNIGVSAFCGSTMAKKSNERDFAASCAALSLWININGKPNNGLINRRAIARAYCEGRKPV